MEELKPCPFCGEIPAMYGRKRRDYVNGEWAKEAGKEFWVKPRCVPSCILGNMHSRAYGVIGGMEYTSPEAAAKAWNRRSEQVEVDFGNGAVAREKKKGFSACLW